MSGTSKKSQGMTERKMKHMGETLDRFDVQVLTTNDLDDDETQGIGKNMNSVNNGVVFKAKDRQL